MVELAVDVDHGAVRAFQEALGQLGASLGSAASTAPRRAAIMVCKSLKAGTKMSKRNRKISARPMNAIPTSSSFNSKWITWDVDRGGKLPVPKRLCEVLFLERTIWGCYEYLEGRGKGEWIKSAKARYGRLYTQEERHGGTRGLAKRSWGWVMHNIYEGAAPDTPWVRRKRDRRNPKDATKDSCSVSSQNASVSFGMARICNRLDYIRSALKVSPEAALEKAAKRIVGTLATRRLKSSGMSSQEIREEAKRITEDFIRRFPMQDNLPGFL